MEASWNGDYAPSMCGKHPRWNAQSSKPVSFNISRIQRNTQALKNLPYEPGLWLLRAQLLLSLGYPELAAGDAHKASLLVEAAFEENSALGLQVRLQYGMCLYLDWHRRWDATIGRVDAHAIDSSNIATEISNGLMGYDEQASSILIISLQHADCFLECQQFAEQAAQKFGAPPAEDTGPWSADYLSSLEDLLQAKRQACERHPEISQEKMSVQRAMLNGAIKMRDYPWILFTLGRSSRTANQMQNLVERASNGRLSVRQSKIVGADLGVFANKPFLADEEIVVDETYMAGTSESLRCSTCCTTLDEVEWNCETCHEQFCCEACLQLAKSLFHNVTCGKAFDFHELQDAEVVEHNVQNPLAETQVLVRFLTIAVQRLQESEQADTHPLQVRELNILRTNHEGGFVVPWNFTQAIVLPTRALRTMGVDVFADHRFDTWVLQTLTYRINNNAAMGYVDGQRGMKATFLQGLFPIHAMCNHSCDPNVRYDNHPSRAAQILRARKSIALGEELYVAYDLGLDAKGMDVWKRREALRSWMGGECKCARCLRESEEQDLWLQAQG